MMKKLFWLIPAIVLTIATVHSCSDTSTSVVDDPDKGSLEGRVITSDSQEGIDNALVVLSAPNITDQETYTEGGKFKFSNLDHGEYQLKIRLPLGYRENDELDREITVDGSISVQVRADPVRQQSATVERGTIDTLATSSGIYLTIDASESDEDIEIYIQEADESVFSGQQILSKPVEIRFGSNGNEQSNQEFGLMRNNFTSSAGTGNKITMSIAQKYSGNPDETMFAFQLDDEDPLFAYAEGVPKDYLDRTVNDGTLVINHEITLLPEDQFRIAVALARIELTCDDPLNMLNYRTLKELDGVLEGENPLILIHGIQLQKTWCEQFIDYNPEVELFAPLIEELRDDDTIRSNYKLYVYRYTSNAPVLENSVALWDMMKSKGIEKPVIIAHSMGGLVARGLMLAEGEDKVKGLITLGTPHEGSILADFFTASDGLQDLCEDKIKAGLFPQICKPYKLASSLVPNTPGFLDLSPNSNLISQLKVLEGSDENIFTLGGKLNPEMDWNLIMGPRIKSPQTNLVYQAGWNILGGIFSYNDGIVPLESALPGWSGLQFKLDDHNHSEVVRGIDDNASRVFEALRPTLLQLVGRNNNFRSFGSFALTEELFPEDSDWDSIILDTMGPEYRVADWNDLVEYHNKNGSEKTLEMLDGLGITERGTIGYLTRNGNGQHTSSRYYFAARHEHQVPGGWAVFDDIDNSLISLGSWWNPRRILAIKR